MGYCPKTAPEIICQLCSMHYYPGTTGNGCEKRVTCNRHFERWLKEEPEVQQIHKKRLESKKGGARMTEGEKNKEFVIEQHAEPPREYVDDVEKCRVIEFITYTTKIVSKGE